MKPQSPPDVTNGPATPNGDSVQQDGWGAWVKYTWDDQETCCVRCGHMIELYEGCEWSDDPALNMCHDCCLTTLREMRPNSALCDSDAIKSL